MSNETTSSSVHLLTASNNDIRVASTDLSPADACSLVFQIHQTLLDVGFDLMRFGQSPKQMSLRYDDAQSS